MCSTASCLSSVQPLSCVSLRPHNPQHARPSCPSPTLRVHPNPCSLSQVIPSNNLILCHPLLLLPSVFPSIRDFSNSQLFASGGQSIGVSAPASVLPMNIQDRFPLGWTGSPCSPRTLKSLLQHHTSKASTLWRSTFLIVQHSYPYMTTGKTIALTIWTFVNKVISAFFF